MFGKSIRMSYKLPNGDIEKSEWLTAPLADGKTYNVGFVNHYKKEVRPFHNYRYPNKLAERFMNYALSIGYTYVDDKMPARKNKTGKQVIK